MIRFLRRLINLVLFILTAALLYTALLGDLPDAQQISDTVSRSKSTYWP